MRRKSVLGVDAGLQQEAAGHQVAGGAALRAEGDLLALHVGQGLDAGVGLGDEDGLETGVLLALGDGDDLAAGADVGLHIGEAAEPDDVDLLVDQRLHGGRVVAHRRELDLHAELPFQVTGQGRELADLLGGGFFGDGRHAQHLLGVCPWAKGEQRAGHQRFQGAGRREVDHGELLADKKGEVGDYSAKPTTLPAGC